MDLLQTLLVYMTVAVSSTIGAAPMPTATPVPTAAPTAVVTPAPVTEAPATAVPVTPAPQATARPQITTNPGYEILRPKMSGEAVKQMQLRLKALGYLTGEADGVFGNQTKSAVMRFQKAHGLTRDGVAGPATLTILYEDPNVIWGPAATPAAAPTAEPTPEPTATPTAEPTALPEPTLVPPLEAAQPVATEIPIHEATGTMLAVLADGRVEVNGALLEADNLVGLSAEMDVLVDMIGLAQQMNWPVEATETGYAMQAGTHRVVWAYTLTPGGTLDLVTVSCDGEPVELTESMTALVGDRLFLAPLWLENLGAQIQWQQDTLTLTITMP